MKQSYHFWIWSSSQAFPRWGFNGTAGVDGGISTPSVDSLPSHRVATPPSAGVPQRWWRLVCVWYNRRGAVNNRRVPESGAGAAWYRTCQLPRTFPPGLPPALLSRRKEVSRWGEDEEEGEEFGRVSEHPGYRRFFFPATNGNRRSIGVSGETGTGIKASQAVEG